MWVKRCFLRFFCGGILGLYFLFSLTAPLYAGQSGHDDFSPVLLGLVVLFLSAKIGGFLAGKIGQPVVLGELLAGVILGNLVLVGFTGCDFICNNSIFKIMAELGVILLLFEVGLESSVEELMRVGFTATIVAVIGVIAPFILGFGTSYLFLPEKSIYVHAFVGATLCATSVGITARVFKDLGKLRTKEAKIILGAAVIDDVLGLLILAIVSGIITNVSNVMEAASNGGVVESFSVMTIVVITLKAFGFLFFAIVAGKKFTPYLFRFGAMLKQEGMLLVLSISFCFFMAYLASLVGLAPIVGAFASGLIIDGKVYQKFFPESESSVETNILYVSKFFVPIFFVRMGMEVDLSTFQNMTVVFFGLTLSFVAILGKQVCGLGIFGKSNNGVNRTLIGIGMIPRGEVGLIFAMIGAGLYIGKDQIVDSTLYSSIVFMVMITTFITPPCLKWALQRKG